MEPTTNKAAAPAAKKNKGGNDGKSPRALRGSPKASTNWTAADEARFQEQQKARETFVAERTDSLKQIAGLLFKGAKTEVIEPVVVDGNTVAEGRTLQAAVTEEQLVANIEQHGDAVLTFLSKHFKLVPTLIKKTH
jgi:hypothetical protein